jgi:exonuclease III
MANKIIKGSVNQTLKSIRITSFNARGLKNAIKRDRVLHLLRNKYPGILFLQETYTTQNDECIWKKQWDGDIFMSH